MKRVLIDETPSTNTLAKELAPTLDHMAVVRAVSQPEGRGQRGNSWESEPGMNLTLSYLFRPVAFNPSRQFQLSECVALAVADTLSGFGVEASVKWPNDIYVGNRKICGILIEHTVMGSELVLTIAGIGINVNQRRFLSDAPNPVSMWQLLGHDTDLDEMEARLTEAVAARVEAVLDPESAYAAACQHEEFKSCLWRGDGGWYPFVDTRGGGELPFEGKIVDVEPVGLLTVENRAGHRESYGFKEIRFVL